jgi:CheY-like chemotaxis protein
MWPFTSESSQPPRALRIVVVDDEPDTVMTLLPALRAEGFDTRGYGSGEAALNGIREFAPDVVVCDLAMPVMNGWDLAREVRKLWPGSRHPLMIAMISEHAQGADEAMLRSAGFNYHLAKPFDGKVLLNVILHGF